ncbi:MAG: hypothetical protein SV760_08675 [Halobacteria archaeon]|nr:hypothetical protein [Halobacteria archaeon]
MTDSADIDDLKEKTQRDDRLTEDEDTEEEDEDELEYASVDEVVLRENAGEDVAELRKQTKRTNRIDNESEEEDEMELSPFEAFDFDEVAEAVDDPYCGNCSSVTFRKRDGEPEPFCSKYDLKTKLESGMVCSDYEPQGVSK